MKVDVLGVKIDSLSYKETLEQFTFFLEKNNKLQIAKVNAEFLVNAQKDEKFKEILNSSKLVTADGIGVLWAAKFLSLKTAKFSFLRAPQIFWQAIYSLLSIVFYSSFIKTVIPERVGGADLMMDMVRICAQKNKPIFLLGGLKSAHEAIKELKRSFPKINIAGFYDGVVNKETTSEIIKKINNSKAEVLFVALGSPKQEHWIYENLPKLETVKISVGEGGSFDYISGKIKRAPKIFQKIGLEWFWRFLVQPKRIKRIWKAVPVFIWTVIKWKINNKEE